LRQIQSLRQAEILIAQALASLDNRLTPELVCQDIRDALGSLDELLGRKFSEELLDKIFSEFCIGK
jgi:tRNA modification GTPase